jgi:predicted cobalt transporter CbtA
MLSARDFLLRGLLAGLVAGVFAFGVAFVVGESSVNASIAVEDSATAGHSHGAPAEPAPADDVVVPRSLQSTLGLLTGTTVAGVTLGGLVGVLSALTLGRFGSTGPRLTTLFVAATGFVALYVIPTLAYPANPPGVGQSDTIGYRSTLYFIMVAISIIAVVIAVLVGRRLAVRWGGWYASLVAIAGYLLVTLTAIALMPSYNEVPATFPATVLYEFRRASFVTQLALWAVLGVVLAELAHRLVQSRNPQSPAEPVRAAV